MKLVIENGAWKAFVRNAGCNNIIIFRKDESKVSNNVKKFNVKLILLFYYLANIQYNTLLLVILLFFNLNFGRKHIMHKKIAKHVYVLWRNLKSESRSRDD